MEQDTSGARLVEAVGTPDDTTAAPEVAASTPAVTVTPTDPRYADLTRGYNLRWVHSPEAIRLVQSRRQVEDAVREAVRAGKRIAVRSGGHCYEGFGTDGQILIDLSNMNTVTFDGQRGAFAVEPGATLGEVYEALYETWGVTLPGGACPSVGIGGHVVGGGHGPLSRLHGLTTDYLHAVEVVTVNAAGRVITTVATRDDWLQKRPKGALWWAHTGGGGGNFGIVTKYWFRTPGSRGSNPTKLLPKPPGQVFVSTVTWPWYEVDEAAFTRLVKNFGSWCERYRAAGTPYDSLYTQFQPTPRAAGSFSMVAQFDATGPDAERLLNEFFAAVGEGWASPRGSTPCACRGCTPRGGRASPGRTPRRSASRPSRPTSAGRCPTGRSRPSTGTCRRSSTRTPPPGC
ncbi:FAD-binding oxidoreductase [Streptomyces stramineus]